MVEECKEELAMKKMVRPRSRRRRRRSYVPRIGCFRVEDDDYHPTITTSRAMSTTDISDGGVSLEMASNIPTHLVVMVNGIVGSADDWKYAAKQFLARHFQDVLVHCSESNSAMLTFDGVDRTGERLANEIKSVINRRPKLQKISFVCHSLGGLIARYAIGILYSQNVTREPDEGIGDCPPEESRSGCTEDKSKGKIAGLEPINFITLATPHLGSRGHKQVPVFGSLSSLENVARHTSWMLSRTGRHLFLTDKDNGKPPLLLQMVDDYGDLQFMSALHSFKRRVAYANARFDSMVGWSSSSIRRQHELPKLQHDSVDDRYPHIVNVEAPVTSTIEQDALLKDKMEKLRTSDMEELMIKGLTRMSWERVDVNFQRSWQRILAHSTIQVKTYKINSAGAGVISHMIDNFLL